MFEDRRSRIERRRHAVKEVIPSSGCRRSKGERRHLLRQYHPQPWWLQAGYVEELQPPTLGNQPAENNPRSSRSGLE